jgi:hypothetical protein
VMPCFGLVCGVNTGYCGTEGPVDCLIAADQAETPDVRSTYLVRSFCGLTSYLFVSTLHG